jgi:hypothetical protein
MSLEKINFPNMTHQEQIEFIEKCNGSYVKILTNKGYWYEGKLLFQISGSNPPRDFYVRLLNPNNSSLGLILYKNVRKFMIDKTFDVNRAIEIIERREDTRAVNGIKSSWPTLDEIFDVDSILE